MNPINFSSLENISKTINKHSDELTEALTAINDKLNSLNLGIPVTNGPTLEILVDDKSFMSDRVDTRRLLGYGKLDGKWGLTVDIRSCRKKKGPLSVEEEQVLADPGFSVPLLSSPRYLRILAVGKMEEFVGHLEKKADALGVVVGKAKKIAENL